MYTSDNTDAIFFALSHPIRRQVIEELGRGPASVSDLAASHTVSLPTFVTHLRALEDAGAVRSKKQGRVRTYELAPEPLAAASQWIEAQRAQWNARLDRLDAYLHTLKEDPQ